MSQGISIFKKSSFNLKNPPPLSKSKFVQNDNLSTSDWTVPLRKKNHKEYQVHLKKILQHPKGVLTIIESDKGKRFVNKG